MKELRKRRKTLITAFQTHRRFFTLDFVCFWTMDFYLSLPTINLVFRNVLITISSCARLLHWIWKSISEAVSQSRIKNDEVTKSWNLGRADYCKDHRTPTYSKVKESILVCGANLLCQKYTRYHVKDLIFTRLQRQCGIPNVFH
jgi:hypothetical protein